MKIRLLVPVVYEEHLYRQGAVIEVSPLEAAKWVHDRVAVPEPDAPRRQVIRPEESRTMLRYD